MSQNLGDKAINDTLYFGFNTHKADGTPITLAGTPAVSIYDNDATAEVTTGVTLTVDFDSRTGYHVVKVVCTDGFYATGHNFKAVITAGTVDSVSVVGTEVAHWTIEKNAALRPTVGGRTLDVAATGEAALDFDNVHDASSAHTLTNITVPVTTTITTPPTDQAVNVTKWNGHSALEAVNGSPVVTLGANQAAYGPAKAGDKMDIVDAPNTTGVAAFMAGFWDKLLTGITTSGSVGELIKDVLTNIYTAFELYSGAYRLTTPALVNAPTGGSGGGSSDWSTGEKQQIRSALGVDGDKNTATGGQLQTIAGYIDTEVASILAIAQKLDTALELDGAVYRFTANALEEAGAGSAPTVGEIADGVCDELLAGHTTTGSLAKALADILTNASALEEDWMNGGRLDLLIDAIKAKTDTFSASDITFIFDRMGGKTTLIGNQLICYKADNVTEVCRFNTKDSTGSPSMTSVYEKDRV